MTEPFGAGGQPGDQVQQRGLARAVGAEQPGDAGKHLHRTPFTATTSPYHLEALSMSITGVPAYSSGYPLIASPEQDPEAAGQQGVPEHRHGARELGGNAAIVVAKARSRPYRI